MQAKLPPVLGAVGRARGLFVPRQLSRRAARAALWQRVQSLRQARDRGWELVRVPRVRGLVVHQAELPQFFQCAGGQGSQ